MNEADTRQYRRVGLGLVLLTAAAPYRYYGHFPVVASVSVLDVALLLAGCGLLVQRAALGSSDVGDPRLFRLLCVLPALSAASALWSKDLNATVRETLAYVEGLVAYVYAVRQTKGVPAEVVIRWLRRFLYLLLVPSVLMLLHVPGFEPEEPGLSVRQGDYLSYFSRLSHPFIGRSNNLATVLAMLVIVFFHWGLTKHDRKTSRAAVLATIAIGLTVSRGVILALLVAGIANMAIHWIGMPRRISRRVVIQVVTAAAAVGGAALAFYFVNPDTGLYISSRLSLSNVFLRETRFGDGVARLAERPLLGYGSGTLPGNDPAITGGVHDTYLQQLLAYGVVLGLVGVLSLVEVTRHFLSPGVAGLRRAVGLTLLAQLGVFAVEASFESSLLRVLFYLILGMLVGLLRAAEEQVPQALAPVENAYA